MTFVLATVLLPRVGSAQDAIGDLVSPGELSRVHSHLARIADCTSCHALGGGVTAERCLSCHTLLAEGIEAGRGLHARVEGRCIDCHTEHRGGQFSIVDLDVGSFDHDRTGYALEPGHQGLVCGRCHTSEVARRLDLSRTYLGLSPDCESCHADVHEGQFRSAAGEVRPCTDCHTVTTWRDAREATDHDRTRFPLTGRHRSVECGDCHGDGRFRPLAMDCASCHDDAHDGQFREPDGRLEACDGCHDTRGWTELSIDHDRTRFPLTGRHVRVECADCHGDGRFRGLATDCASCHTDPHDGQFREPDGRTTACTSCHDTLDWNKTRVDHDRTRFPLTGAHRRVDCEDCHEAGRFRPVDVACGSCHDDVHRGQFLDETGALQACVDCHDTLAWAPARIDHDATGFPLTGAHREVECVSCHDGGHYRSLGSECIDCHSDPHDGQFREAHGGLTPCRDCHGTDQWEEVRFDHEQTRFPLAGAHAQVECTSCHVDGRFDLATDCASCHADPHEGGEGPVCASCHSTTTWETIAPDAHDDAFPLRGMHAVTPCDTCHLSAGVFVTRRPEWSGPGACASCHVDPHLGQFDSTCSDCHRETSWLPPRFRHDDTAFPLRGAHKAVLCADCHSNRLYRDTPTACFACHSTDFDRATGIDHRASVLIDCERCHGTTAFLPARFEHSFFALTGGHRGLACEQCHGGGNFGPISDACVACHQSDFDRAPRHLALGLPAFDCESCHEPTTFDRHLPALRVDCFACHRAEYLAPSTRPDHVAAGFGTACDDCHSPQSWRPAREPAGQRRKR